MMAWENLEEPRNENESDLESVPDNNPQKNVAEKEEADDEFSESSSSTDYGCLECERIQRQPSFAWQHEDKYTTHWTKEQEGRSKKKLTIPEK